MNCWRKGREERKRRQEKGGAKGTQTEDLENYAFSFNLESWPCLVLREGKQARRHSERREGKKNEIFRAFFPLLLSLSAALRLGSIPRGKGPIHRSVPFTASLRAFLFPPKPECSVRISRHFSAGRSTGEGRWNTASVWFILFSLAREGKRAKSPDR